MSAPISRSDVDAFRLVLARETGLRFDDGKLSLLEEVLRTRVGETNSSSVDAYLDRTSTTPQEWGELARTLSVSETYFLRNRDQLRAFEATLRKRVAAGKQHLRILSAGCSSGEEPYSLAMIVRETIADLDAWTLSIHAVDLNPDALERARRASYSPWSLRETPETFRNKYFQKNGPRYELVERVRGMVRFEHQNLLQPSAGLWRSEAFDFVFCRNVLMYLTPTAAREVVTRIARSLSPGGHLFLGHAENLRGLSQDFHLRHSHDTFYYERRGAESADGETISRPDQGEAKTSLPDDTSWFDAIARASSRIERLSDDSEGSNARESRSPRENESERGKGNASNLSPALSLLKQEKFREALRLLTSTSADSAEPDAMLLRAMLLVSTGDPAAAESLCAELLTIDELSAGAHYIMAICREHAGDRAGAVEHSQAAAYLDPEFAMPHLQLGRLARRAGDLATARRELGLALGLLSRENSARITLFGGGFSRDALIQLCRGELDACKEDT